MNYLYKSVFLVMKTILISSIVIFSSYAQSISQLEKECNSNKFISCGILGSRYHLGEGIGQNKIKASVLYQKACNGGDSLGLSDVSMCETNRGT